MSHYYSVFRNKAKCSIEAEENDFMPAQNVKASPEYKRGQKISRHDVIIKLSSLKYSF